MNASVDHQAWLDVLKDTEDIVASIKRDEEARRKCAEAFIKSARREAESAREVSEGFLESHNGAREGAKLQAEQIIGVLPRSDRDCTKRWGSSRRKLLLTHGKSVRVQHLDVLSMYKRVIGSVAVQRNRRKLNGLLYDLGQLSTMPSLIAKRLWALCVLAILKLGIEATDDIALLTSLFREVDSLPLLEQPLSRIPKVQPNAPNALI